MMNKMLVDTSGFFSLYDEADEYHRLAVSLYDAAAKRPTTNYVLAEYTALAQARDVPRREIIKFSNRCGEFPNL
jgi:predicted nucleic acid-binding protein